MRDIVSVDLQLERLMHNNITNIPNQFPFWLVPLLSLYCLNLAICLALPRQHSFESLRQERIRQVTYNV